MPLPFQQLRFRTSPLASNCSSDVKGVVTGNRIPSKFRAIALVSDYTAVLYSVIEGSVAGTCWLTYNFSSSKLSLRDQMPYLKPERPEKVTAPSLKASKARSERLVCLTAYDYPTARIVDEAGIDVILVGDSLGNVVLGYGYTIPVTLEDILVHVKAVRRGVQRALLVADMPYGSFHTGEDDTVRAALRLVKESGAEAVKLEGGQKRVKLVRRLVNEEIAVMGHIGLTPQSINQLGAYRV